MKHLLCLAIVLAFLTGCNTTPTKINDVNMLPVIHKVSDTLIARAELKISQKSPMLIASFVDINQLDKSSSFGRIISQQIGSAVSAKGYMVKEMLLRNNVYIKQSHGEFLLSRQLRDISSKHKAQAVIVGTYAIGKNTLYATAKIISVENNTIISSYDFTLPLGPDIKELLRK